MSDLVRNCPICNVPIYYKLKGDFNRAIKLNQTCLSCSYKRITKYNIENFINTEINNWKVLSFAYKRANNPYWTCKCRCGNICTIRAYDIVLKRTKQCNECRINDLNYIRSITWEGGNFLHMSLLNRAKSHALFREIEFSVSMEQLESQWIKQNGKCIYTNVSLTFPKNSKDLDFNCSLDRKDSNGSYDVNNIQWVLKEVNVMKNQYTEERFLEICEMITKHKKKKDE